MKRLAFPIALVALALTGPLPGQFAIVQNARAQDVAQEVAEPRDGRYAIHPTADGFVRLDTRNGTLSHCRTSSEGVQCRTSADERAALDAEIERLTKANEDLRRKLAAATDQAPTARLRNALPTDEEVNRAMGWMESFMQRMKRMMREDSPPGERL
jgi:hypothetical protein